MKGKTTLIICGLGVLLMGCVPETHEVRGQGVPQVTMVEVTGTLTYREKIALPDNAQITVTLEDTSLADAKGVLIDRQTFTTEGKQVPVNFKLQYNSTHMDPRHRYTVRAQIRVKDTLRFTTDTSVAVITDKAQTHHVQLQLKRVD
ncbi:YbaY family lipoprotein [Vibrio rarus]|uniref:YbaY family lipoprotein n=1 Tax=Vibrio rarus TaxID=413403 RepID=UPI0021C2B375|nr:YbaY family lipoprotein [Vibrio rarus]